MRDLPRRTVTAIAYGAVVLVAVAAPEPVFWALLLVAGAVSLAELWRLRVAGAPALVEAVLVVVGLVSLGTLRVAQAGPLPWALLLVLGATWATDVGAYVGGSLVGRRKIAPRISPGKTWEGTIIGCAAGGTAFLLLNAALGSWYGGPLQYGLPMAWIVAIGVGPVAFGGDLLESWVKRRAGVKDSGTLLPGHGGMLDRIDSLVATAPFVLLPLLLPCCAASLG